MGFFGAAMKAWDVASEAQAALAAARGVLADGGSPLKALRAFADATEGQLDDAVVAELEAGIRRAVAGLEVASRVALTVAESLADPRVRAALDMAIGAAIEAGYRAGAYRAKLRSWTEE